MCNTNGDSAFGCDATHIVLRGEKYPVRILHYWQGRDLHTDRLPDQVKALIEKADRMGSKRLTVAMVTDAPLPLIAHTFWRKGEQGTAKEGRLRAKDRLFTVVRWLGGNVVA